jgi:hypothetical protein
MRRSESYEEIAHPAERWNWQQRSVEKEGGGGGGSTTHRASLLLLLLLASRFSLLAARFCLQRSRQAPSDQPPSGLKNRIKKGQLGLRISHIFSGQLKISGAGACGSLLYAGPGFGRGRGRGVVVCSKQHGFNAVMYSAVT